MEECLAARLVYNLRCIGGRTRPSCMALGVLLQSLSSACAYPEPLSLFELWRLIMGLKLLCNITIMACTPIIVRVYPEEW